MTVKHPAFRYHGAKYRLAPWIMGFFPAHLCYVEPYGGAAGVLLQKPRSYAEVYNDLDADIVNFFRVLRDPETREKLTEALVLTPYSRDDFTFAFETTDDPVERARRTAIRAQMGFGSAGSTKGMTGFRIDTKRECATAQHLWERYPDTIRTIGERFAGVLIENRPAIRVMLQHDTPETLHYVDPPYVHETRDKSASSRNYYRHEMTDDEHLNLLETLKSLDGYVVLSGYENDIYDNQLEGWTKHSTNARISAHRGTGIRKECVWINPACAKALDLESAQRTLFALNWETVK